MDEQLEEYEQRFRRAGLPLFIEGFTASEDVFNRAVPFLGIVFTAQMLGALNLDWSLAANVAAVAAGLAILMGAIGLRNYVRGRPIRSVPRVVGKPELAMFVLLPTLLPLIFGAQWRSAVVVAIGNVLCLVLVYAVIGLGLLAILRWVLARFMSQLKGSLELIARAVPLLAIFALLSFTTQEMWQVFSSMTAAMFWAIIALFVALGTAFLVVRLPREARELEHETKADEVPLRRRQRLNVGLVMFVSQAVQVLIVSLVVAVFFAAFGLLAINESLRIDWIGSTGEAWLSFELFGEQLEVTRELLRVALGLGAFSGFYFAIAMLTDSTYREEFLDELSDEMRASFEARAAYLRLRATSAA